MSWLRILSLLVAVLHVFESGSAGFISKFDPGMRRISKRQVFTRRRDTDTDGGHVLPDILTGGNELDNAKRTQNPANPDPRTTGRYQQQATRAEFQSRQVTGQNNGANTPTGGYQQPAGNIGATQNQYQNAGKNPNFQPGAGQVQTANVQNTGGYRRQDTTGALWSRLHGGYQGQNTPTGGYQQPAGNIGATQNQNQNIGQNPTFLLGAGQVQTTNVQNTGGYQQTTQRWKTSRNQIQHAGQNPAFQPGAGQYQTTRQNAGRYQRPTQGLKSAIYNPKNYGIDRNGNNIPLPQQQKQGQQQQQQPFRPRTKTPLSPPSRTSESESDEEEYHYPKSSDFSNSDVSSSEEIYGSLGSSLLVPSTEFSYDSSSSTRHPKSSDYSNSKVSSESWSSSILVRSTALSYNYQSLHKKISNKFLNTGSSLPDTDVSSELASNWLESSIYEQSDGETDDDYDDEDADEEGADDGFVGNREGLPHIKPGQTDGVQGKTTLAEPLSPRIMATNVKTDNSFVIPTHKSRSGMSNSSSDSSFFLLYSLPAVIIILVAFVVWRNLKGRGKVVKVMHILDDEENANHTWNPDYSKHVESKSKELEPMLEEGMRDREGWE